MIIIFSDGLDSHATFVAEKLKSNYQEHSIVLDLSQLGKSMSIAATYSGAEPQLDLILNDNSRLNISDVKSFWWRRPQHVAIDPAIQNPTYRAFASREWHTALTGIWQSTEGLWVNDIQKQYSAEHKSYQLTVAKHIGLSVPDTLITNNPSSAISFYEKHHGKLVYKAFVASRQAWRETRPLRREFLDRINTVRYAPVIFQEYINNSSDIRVTSIGKQVFAAEAKPDQKEYQYDFRMSSVPWKEHKLPYGIKDLILKYMETLGLEYGAIDMKVTADGQYFFLEINPSGQFLFIEFHTHLPISQALTDHLVRGVRRN